MRRLLIVSFCLLFSIVNSAKVDIDLINETIRDLLHFKNSDPNITSFHRQSHTLTEHMKDLYQIFIDEDSNEDGNLVRAIEPAVGKLDGQEVLVFDVEGFDSDESIMRAELHFFLRRRDAFSRRRSRQIRAKSVCVNEYCRPQTLKRIRGSSTSGDEMLEDFKVVWDATKSVFDSYHLDGKQAVFRITREHSKMRPYAEMIRKSTPFLVIYSKVNHTLDTKSVIQQAEQTKRKRRDLGNEELREYYTYNSIPLDNDEREPVKRKAGKKNSLSEEMSSEDVWQGFGEETSREDRERKENEEMANDVRVVLLQNKNRCHKEGTLVSLKHFGWDRFVMEPKTIETSFCKGKCAKPMLTSGKASNHAMLQSLFAAEPVCCAPTNLKSLNFLYRDEKGRTVIRNYSKMLIGSCSCL
ncbi:CRE-UNC-129 protein [Caenorhabditis remanei]|uniref:CRE-UNC-129 protein n=1 Tax=Caenorhabditis remanei TaxID=31234 RepID=E3NHI2_CAERE|nr:CRE-UNC-129 protein [Caenorhabditis remanei]